ncbi:MAG: Stp1/IreP family PP2C-type Ser/Thr phosphatase [Microthrixaceae bacterium]
MSEPEGRLVLRAGAATDTGRIRAINQDSYAMLPELGIYVVADGMGGAQGGEVASRMAIDAIREGYQEPSATALAEVIAHANDRIHAAADDPNLRGMGTTTVALAIVPEEPDPDAPEPDVDPPQHLLVANVGDSRAYLLRDGGLTQITDDHSVVAELVRDGHITASEAEAHPQRNIITRVLGVYPEVAADLWPIDPVRGDRYLLCSDGLFNEVTDDQITAALRRLHDPGEAAAELVRLANEGGGRDNITVIVVDVVADGGVAESASAALAGETTGSSRPAQPDIAGFTTARAPQRDTTDSTQRSARAARRARQRAARKARSRLSWRALLFVLLVLGVIAGAFATIQWYGTSTYYVGFHGDEVAIYQGRPGGLLWIDPTLQQDTAIARDEVPARYVAALEAGHEHASLSGAKLYVSNIERDIIATTALTTTTTAAPTTSTTGPASPPNN